MEFLEMIEKLKQMYINRIVLISCGAFYIATGEDAVILNGKLNLKVNCAKKYACKVGVPKNSIEKYIKKLNELNYQYIVLDYEKEQNKIIKKCIGGEKDKPIYNFNKGCEQCKNNKIERTEYDTAFKKYIDEEFEKDQDLNLTQSFL